MLYELPPGSEVVGENWDDYTLPSKSKEQVITPEAAEKQNLINWISGLSGDELKEVLFRLSVPNSIIAGYRLTKLNSTENLK